jgi:signal transduction histidine kinase
MLGIIFIFITLFTSAVIKDIMFNEDGVLHIIYGKMVFIFFGAVFILSLISFITFIKKYFQTNDIKLKKKIKYLLFGLSFFILMNTIFNIYYPVFRNIVHLYYFGDYSTIVFLSLTSYTIIKYKLFNIRVIIVEIFTFALWLITAIELFLAPSWFEKFYKLIIFVLAIIFGILLIRSAKNEIRQREKLEKLTKQLERANKKLKKLDATKSEFISIASHQLRTPLTVIKGYISMIKAGDFGKLAEKAIDPLEKVYESSNRLITLVANLLNVSRIESGRLYFNFRVMQLEELVESVVEELTNKAKNKGLNLIYKRLAEPLPKVKIDEEKIRQVVVNLIDNSIKYTKEGSVKVSLSQEDGNIKFCVADTGAGIKKEDMAKLFQKFSRGTGSTKQTEGTGLGLFVARQMIEAHKGRIWAESEGEGRGSKFCFILPIR